MGRIIPAEEFAKKGAVGYARWLLGKHLVRRHENGAIEARMITETEAYSGERDLACHARAGRTARTEVMYRAGGVWYVYLCYGVHEMLNLVVARENWPAAVLIRGVEDLTGPGRVTKGLGIDRRLNGAAAAVESGLWIEDRGGWMSRQALLVTPRIGVDYAGEVWAKKPWRFAIAEGKAKRSVKTDSDYSNSAIAADRPERLGRLRRTNLRGAEPRPKAR